MSTIIDHNDEKIQSDQYYKDILLFCKLIGRPDVVIEEEDGGRLFFRPNKLIEILRIHSKMDMNMLYEYVDKGLISKVEFALFYIDIGYELYGYYEIWDEFIEETLEKARKEKS